MYSYLHLHILNGFSPYVQNFSFMTLFYLLFFSLYFYVPSFFIITSFSYDTFFFFFSSKMLINIFFFQSPIKIISPHICIPIYAYIYWMDSLIINKTFFLSFFLFLPLLFSLLIFSSPNIIQCRHKYFFPLISMLK